MFIIALFVISYVAMLLWNVLIPDLFHGPELTYWQTMGLLVLARLFVGGHCGRGRWKHGRWGRHRHHHHQHHPWGARHRGRPWRGRAWGSWSNGPEGQHVRDEVADATEDDARDDRERWRGSKRGEWGPWSDMTAEDWFKFKQMSPQERRHMKEAWKAEFKARWQRPPQEPPAPGAPKE